MCTIFFAYKIHPKYPFIYIGNRDEFYSRPTERAKYHHGVLMGRDLEKGGTWFGLKNDKIGFLTNYRDMDNIKENASTRGHLIVEYLLHNIDTVKYIRQLKKTHAIINDYNLVIGDLNELFYYSSLKSEHKRLEPGVYGLSNAFLNTPWPKVEKGKKQLEGLKDFTVEDLFSILDDQSIADDSLLPDTKLEYEWEKALSALHVDHKNYGTVYKQVVLYDGKTITYYDKTIEDNFKSMASYKIEV